MAELWTPSAAPLLKHRAKVRTVTLRDGRRAKVTIDDSGCAVHVETNDGIDAIARPRPVDLKLWRFH